MHPPYGLSRALIARRGFAAAASPIPARASKVVSPIEEKVSRLPNGLTIASVDLQGAVSQLLIAFRAGSRFEQPDESGLVHLLRNTIGTDSGRFSGMKLLWQSGSIGSNIVASASKELFTIQTSVIRNYEKVALSILGELAQPAFKPWDVELRRETLPFDHTHQQPLDLVLENLHKAAFRNGTLSIPILSPPHQIGKRSLKQLAAYTKSRLVSANAAIVGINVDHSTLLSYASEQAPVAEGSAKQASPSPYFGGDEHVSGDTSLAHVAVAGQGARLSDVKSVATQAVLCAAIGKGPNGKLAETVGSGVVARHVFKAANRNPVGVSAINVAHSDVGLAGVYLVADGDKMGPYVRAAVAGLEELAKTGPDAQMLGDAKRAAALETLVSAESSAQLAVDIAVQVLANGTTVSPQEFIQLINQVSVEDVKKAAAQITTKLSISAYGQTHQVPYSDVL